MTRVRVLVISFLCCVVGCEDPMSPPDTQGDRWRFLFNTRDFSGGSVQCPEPERGQRYWQVKDGVIECNSLEGGRHDYHWLLGLCCLFMAFLMEAFGRYGIVTGQTAIHSFKNPSALGAGYCYARGGGCGPSPVGGLYGDPGAVFLHDRAGESQGPDGHAPGWPCAQPRLGPVILVLNLHQLYRLRGHY
jgi:hypothetical protein